MNPNGIAKVQHYVPQFLLRQFGNGKKDQLHVFDKKSGRTFTTNAKNVASESRFYDFHVEGKALTLEPSLSKIEGRAKPLFEKILAKDTLVFLSPEDKVALCIFLSIQFTRTRAFREQWRELPELLGDRLRRTARTAGELQSIDDYFRAPDDNETKIYASRFMMDAPKDLAKHFSSKIWVLLATTRKNPFVIGDNPISMQNTIDMAPYGNLGLAVRGIEIYFPISPLRALGFWCPTFSDIFRKARYDLRQMNAVAPSIVAAYVKDPARIEQTLVAMETGCPLHYREENVTNFNSLQVHYAERYLFSSTNDFSLPLEMITAHPSLKKGPRAQLN
jgi:hypothetical protein